MSRRIGVMEAGKLLTVKDTKALFADPGSIAAALLTGCKNIVPARKCGDFEVEVPDWGLRLQTARRVEDGLVAIGIRAHYFHPDARQNRFAVCAVEEMEEPFELILQFRYATQRPDSPPVWWRLNKEKRPPEFPEALGIAPANILLLYD